MRKDFAAFILTHGRPDNVITYKTLRRDGYTGDIFIVIDDEDDTADAYHKRYGDEVLTFNKAEIAATFDTGDLSTRDRLSIVYARNAVWKLAEQVGVRYFIQLDDDYTAFSYKMVGVKHDAARPDYWHGWKLKRLDAVFEMMLVFLEQTPTKSIALVQGGEQIGGASSHMGLWKLKRKAMNSFICDVERPFTFVGRINDDVNTYVQQGATGSLFFTYSALRLDQIATQDNPGGMSDTYRDTGTYIKSFYSVMYAPSSVTIRTIGFVSPRLHHRVHWNHAVPKIVAETHRRLK